MGKQTISSLLSDASKKLRNDFEFIRTTNPHPGGKGEEVEKILRDFLNLHMPKRFSACSGITIDIDNNMSKQTDVIIYDNLSSPIYRSSETVQIVPYDTVAAVIEVKSAINKKEIEDACLKIASAKRLIKRPVSELDQRSTGSRLTTIGTYGIIFGFSTEIKLETIAKHMKELNGKYESSLWPDMIIVLDEGVIDYGISFPGDTKIEGTLAPCCDEKFLVFPVYVSLSIHKDKSFSLNRFFCNLLSHLTFYPRRPSTPPFSVMLEGTQETAMSITGYQFDLGRRLKPVPLEMYTNPKPNLSMAVFDATGMQIGVLDYIPWQDGSALRWIGGLNFEELRLHLLNPALRAARIIHHAEAQYTSVIVFSEDDFRKLPSQLLSSSLLKGTIVE